MPRFSKRQKKRVIDARQAGVVLFAMVMVVGTLVGVAFARPATSTLENRNLTAFPQFTIESFLNGSFFSDFSLWYADTYPNREWLVQASQAMKGAYGIQGDTQMIGSDQKADEIPDEVKSDQELTEDERAAQEAKQAEREAARLEAEQMSDEEAQARIQQQLVGSVYLEGGTGYGFYWFSQDQSDAYIDVINQAASKLKGQAKVYSLLVPTSGGVMLSDAENEAAGGSSQAKALDYFKKSFSEDVTVVDCLDLLREHNDEYLYFRTDHHWTQVGAYYAYVAFCEARGSKPADVLSWRQIDSGEMLGSLYLELGGVAEMANNPDDVVGYVPASTNDLTFELDGEVFEGDVISDASDWDPTGKYLAYITGDRALVTIQNPKKDDGSSCLVVKDSYGNPFVPCLVDDYQTVYAIDPRYSSRDIIQFVRENNIQDVIFENSLSLTADYTMCNYLASQTAGA